MKKWYRLLVWLLVLSMMLGMVACNDGIFPPVGGILGGDQTPGGEPGEEPGDVPDVDPDDIPDVDPDDIPEIDPDDIPDLDGDVTATGLTFALKGDGTYEVTGVTALGDTVAVIIPSVHEGRAVTSIGARAFYNCADILSVVIPGSVKTIGSEAF
ncbi:MAG: hypothetical protein J6S44_03250, partial [Clostridia bacterium]|nr:hypothetical protein [Clostridia bacterium]